MKKLRNILFCFLLSPLFLNKNFQTYQLTNEINKFFEIYLDKEIKEKKSFGSRFRQYGEPLLCSVPTATWLLGNYLKKPTLKKIGKYGIHANLFHLVSKNCFNIYKAYENNRVQEYSLGEIIKDLCFNNTPVTILKNAARGTLNFITEHPTLFVAIAESIAMKKNEESEREKLQPNVSKYINESTHNYGAPNNSYSEEEEIASEKKEEKKEKEKTESHPLALVGLCLIPPIFLVTAIWACIENQPFFAECKALQKELENKRVTGYSLLQGHIQNVKKYNNYDKNNSDEGQTKTTDYKKACEALIYNQSLIKKKSDLLKIFFELEKNIFTKTNPYGTTLDEEEI